MIHTVSFPGLGLEFTLNRVAFSLFGLPIYWYGLIIVAGIVLATLLCCRLGKRFGIGGDQILDMMLFAVPVALAALRAYYVIFNLDLYRTADGGLDWRAILNFRDGGLAIYGAILSSALVLFLFCRARKLSFLAFADLGVHGLFLGQSIGRWGNFMNVEAFGSVTAAPWRMCGQSIAEYLLSHGDVTTDQYQAVLTGELGVHPTFFYESAWNLLGLLMVYRMGKKRRFDGQCCLFYLFWYGLGRTWIEGLRTDSLYLFGWELFGIPIRVSQLLAAVSSAAAGILLVYFLRKYRRTPRELFADKLAREAGPASAESLPAPEEERKRLALSAEEDGGGESEGEEGDGE